VGVVLYETVTGRPYFEAESAAKVEHLIRNYRTWRPMPAHLPAGFQAVLRRALHPDPSMRYASAEDFAADLRAVLENRRTVAESMPEAEDPEKTRRTARTPAANEPEEATRRTVPPRVEPPAHLRRKPQSRRERQIRLFIALGIVVLGCAIGAHEFRIWDEASDLARELRAERLKDVDEAWNRYHALAGRSYIPVVLGRARAAMRERLTAAADRVIAEYRSSDAPSISEADWVRARDSLARALELDPGDKEIRGRLALCEGHISRIRGTARNNGKLLNDARMQFETARELMAKSPDPYLGLARLYVYSLRDVDRAEEALRAAGKRGHEMGKREKAQLADGYRDRAERLLREADRVTGLPEEKDYLERAKSDFQRAEELYREIVPFAGSATSLRRVIEFREHVDVRLQIIREGA